MRSRVDFEVFSSRHRRAGWAQCNQGCLVGEYPNGILVAQAYVAVGRDEGLSRCKPTFIKPPKIY
jgi:hypothetical protein